MTASKDLASDIRLGDDLTMLGKQGDTLMFHSQTFTPQVLCNAAHPFVLFPLSAEMQLPMTLPNANAGNDKRQ